MLRRNSKAAFYEPLAGAAAHALATVLDRIRHGTLPGSVESDARVQQAALVAANVAARPERWLAFRAELHALGAVDARTLAIAALAFGWRDKWRSP